MIKIKRISNEDGMHYYKFNSSQDIHNELINFFNSLNFPSNELNKIDIIFSDMDGEWFYIKKDKMKVHFFVSNNEINMVIDSNQSQEDLSNAMKDYFIFP